MRLLLKNWGRNEYLSCLLCFVNFNAIMFIVFLKYVQIAFLSPPVGEWEF